MRSLLGSNAITLRMCHQTSYCSGSRYDAEACGDAITRYCPAGHVSIYCQAIQCLDLVILTRFLSRTGHWCLQITTDTAAAIVQNTNTWIFSHLSPGHTQMSGYIQITQKK